MVIGVAYELWRRVNERESVSEWASIDKKKGCIILVTPQWPSFLSLPLMLGRKKNIPQTLQMRGLIGSKYMCLPSKDARGSDSPSHSEEENLIHDMQVSERGRRNLIIILLPPIRSSPQGHLSLLSLFNLRLFYYAQLWMRGTILEGNTDTREKKMSKLAIRTSRFFSSLR